MATHEMEAELFGRETRFQYSETWVGYSLLALRLVMGWVFLYAGFRHLTSSGFSNAVRGVLTGAATNPANPFQGLWQWMLGYVGILTPLNAWGLFLVGLALVLGVLVRFSAFWGAVMMIMYWGTSLPLKHGIVIDDHVVYALLLFGLGAFGAGRIFGLDKLIEETDLVRNNRWITYFLG